MLFSADNWFHIKTGVTQALDFVAVVVKYLKHPGKFSCLGGKLLNSQGYYNPILRVVLLLVAFNTSMEQYETVVGRVVITLYCEMCHRACAFESP
ncbi:hypothetical protein C5167_029397 [Papaver somniferum]|nr:hypothetical protein C5167_029397 [Papaver somniferum]